jgi:hypothetical protein
MEGSGRTVVACPTTSHKPLPPTNSAPEPAHGRQPDSAGPTSLAPRLAPGGLQACHGVHRSPVPRAGQPARPGNRRAACQTHRLASPATSPTTPSCATPKAASRGQRSAWPSPAAGEQEASFFTVVVWRDQAEHAAESLSKGSRVGWSVGSSSGPGPRRTAAPARPSRSWPKSWDRACAGRPPRQAWPPGRPKPFVMLARHRPCAPLSRAPY